MAQSSTWDVHPLNTIPCPEWIYPEPGCGGCGSCRMAIDTEPGVMDGGMLHWSDGLVMCPHPIDTLGNNVVVITNWPIASNVSSFLHSPVEFHQDMRIDTLEVICATANGGPDSVEVAVQFNGTDPQTALTVLQGALTGQFVHYTVTDLGCIPLSGGMLGTANIYVRAHGSDLGFIFKGMRVVASPCLTTSVMEMHNEEATIRAMEGGVSITTLKPTEVTICDALGRVTFFKGEAMGTTSAPLSSGLNIVRAGTTVRKIVQ